MTPRKPVFIEQIFPVTLLNQQVYYEHGGNPFKGLHRWYSRKPLSFSRASVLGALLPAEVSLAEFEYLLGLDRPPEKDTEVTRSQRWSQKLYKTPPSPERIQRVQELCEEFWGKRQPVVLDAFAGGGSIPFEAVRYGLNVLASDLNPVAVVTMKAAMEYPLKFGPGLQEEINRWVQWVGDEAQRRLAEFFPSQDGETVQNYLWAHTVVCPSCESVVPLSPNWWLSKTSNYGGKGQPRKITSDWYAVRPIPKLAEKRVEFEIVRGQKSGTGIRTAEGEEYDPDSTITVNRGVGKCPCCGSVIDDEAIKQQFQAGLAGHQLYAVAFKQGAGLEFRIPEAIDLDAVTKAEVYLASHYQNHESEQIGTGSKQNDLIRYGLKNWFDLFNPRQLLTLVTYVDIIQDAKEKLFIEYEPEKVEAISTYLALVLTRCADANSRLTHWSGTTSQIQLASGQHALNLIWNYPEVSGINRLWQWCADASSLDYRKLTEYLGCDTNSLDIRNLTRHSILINSASADALFHIKGSTVDAVITDPPYYATIQYAELADFFYVWQKRTLGDIFPDLFWMELTDKDREAVANPSRFRDMGESPEVLANRDYEAKMALAFAEYYRVLRDDGVMVVQFNHKDSGAWDVLAKSLIDSGFEITASWAVSTENPQNLHQAQKNSVASTVLLVCRKRDVDAGSAWWEDLRPEVANLVEKRAPDFEANDIQGIDLYLSAFGPALNVFSRHYPILDSSGVEVRPEQAFAEARKAVANYRFYKLLQTDTAGFDPLTQWYLLAWDAFRAREFPFDDARQLALAVGGFNVADLSRTYKLLDIKSGTCRLLTPEQRLRKRAFAINEAEFSSRYLVDALHSVIALYTEEATIEPVRRLMKTTGLLSNDLFMRAWEVALKVIPHISDAKKRIPEEKGLADLWLAMDEIKAKVTYTQPELELFSGQIGLDFDSEAPEES